MRVAKKTSSFGINTSSILVRGAIGDKNGAEKSSAEKNRVE